MLFSTALGMNSGLHADAMLFAASPISHCIFCGHSKENRDGYVKGDSALSFYGKQKCTLPMTTTLRKARYLGCFLMSKASAVPSTSTPQMIHIGQVLIASSHVKKGNVHQPGLIIPGAWGFPSSSTAQDPITTSCGTNSPIDRLLSRISWANFILHFSVFLGLRDFSDILGQ